MSTANKHSLAYQRFLNLVQAIRGLPGLPSLDPVEERILNLLAAAWDKRAYIPVLDVIKLLDDISPSTAHRRIKHLCEQGMLALQSDAVDKRIKYVVATELTHQYFTRLGECMERVRTER